MKPIRLVITAAFLIAPAIMVGCGSSSPSSQTATTEPSEKTYAPPPAGSPLAKIKVGEDSKEVTDTIGQPTSEGAYVTGKAFIPFYFGGDTHRVQYLYKGQGRIILSPNSQFTSGLSVIEIEYDPSETGYNH